MRSPPVERFRSPPFLIFERRFPENIQVGVRRWLLYVQFLLLLSVVRPEEQSYDRDEREILHLASLQAGSQKFFCADFRKLQPEGGEAVLFGPDRQGGEFFRRGRRNMQRAHRVRG